MKLIYLLVQELPKRGGWPGSQYDGKVMALDGVSWSYKEGCYPTAYSGGERVIRSEYEAALAASQQTAWNGEGLPPVGTVCEVLWNEARMEYLRTKVFGVNEHGQPIHRFDEGPNIFMYQAAPLISSGGEKVFRPLRSEAERKREEAMVAIWGSSGIRARDGGRQAAFDIYDAIASGKIPHITLK